MSFIIDSKKNSDTIMQIKQQRHSNDSENELLVTINKGILTLKSERR